MATNLSIVASEASEASVLAWNSIFKNESIPEEAKTKLLKWDIVKRRKKVSKDIFHKHDCHVDN